MGSALEPWSPGDPYDRTLPTTITPAQSDVEEAVEGGLGSAASSGLTQWINFQMGSPGEIDPTGEHPDPNPDIDFPERERKRDEHGHEFNDPYGPGFDELQRYHRDAADIVRRKEEEGSITIMRCRRAGDQATIYWDPAKRAMVIVRDGKIANYFPPDRGYEYFREQCDLGTLD